MSITCILGTKNCYYSLASKSSTISLWIKIPKSLPKKVDN